MSNKLYIYDNSDKIDRSQADGRFAKSSGLTTLSVGSVAELHKGLTALLTKGQTFTRVLFQTHGHSGRILFGDDRVYASDFAVFAGFPYHLLFPTRTKIYFDGCNVAEGEAGWAFLAAAGKALLRTSGGITMGYTSVGFGMPGWAPFISGHTVHAWGSLRIIDFGARGVEIERFDGSDAFDDLNRAIRIVSSLDNF